MKTIPPPCPEPETGRAYWRSLDQLAETPAFQEWMEREFPAGASEVQDPLTRRHFLKIMSASFAFAGLGLTGCRRPEQTIYPFTRMPENYTHGVPQYYATAMPGRRQALPLLVKSHDGRPTKIEGNPEHPDSNGATDAWAQASLLNLYDPDRAQRFVGPTGDVTRAAVNDFLVNLSKQSQANQGKGLVFLLEQNNSPSRARLVELLRTKLPQSRWFQFEPVDANTSADAASMAFGSPVQPCYRLENARLIVSLDSDFLGSEEDAWRHIRGFARQRSLQQPGHSPARLYVCEGVLSVTGANADHRLRLPPGLIGAVAARLTLAVVSGQSATIAPEITQALNAIASQDMKQLSNLVDKEDAAWLEKWLAGCAKDLLTHRGTSLVMAGYRQPLAVHLLAHVLNNMLGNNGTTVQYLPSESAPFESLSSLAGSLQQGSVDTLVILGGNPVYNAPADLDWIAAQPKAKTVVRLGYFEDETFPLCTWHLPAAHYLESWGDARSSDGTRVAIQPLIAPLFGGLTELELLARIGGLEKYHPYEIVRETFRVQVKETNDDEAGKKFLHDGFWVQKVSNLESPAINWAQVGQELKSFKCRPAPDPKHLEVVFYRDYRIDDGRYSNNGWLQEMPDPITKITWDNAVLLSRRTARELQLNNGDLIEIKLDGRVAKGPVWIQPGMANYTLGLALGYGRTRAGRVGNGVGFNFYSLRASHHGGAASGASVQLVGATYQLACTQDHWSMEGRPIVREATFKQFLEQPNFAKRMNMEEPPLVQPMYENPLDKARANALHQWGMTIDLNACVGCGACILACQSENNIPIVGKEQVSKGREMHWLRIDRYFTSDPARQKDHRATNPESAQSLESWIDDPQVVQQPMLCQHCEAAPCESVCPVNATVHDDEGLNVMAYNRCVGTRYCSNNCPYKVRRFNFFDYNKRPFQNGQLYWGPLAKKPEDELSLAKLAKNPDVTVRMRGVMEKCTFCVQRVEQAKIAQKIKAGPSNNVEVKDGVIKTACQQSCPAEAIVFGNVADPASRVSKLKQNPRNYSVLEFLNTKPRTTYLARVRNPNPEMPDYFEAPLSSREYEDHNHVHAHEPPAQPAPTAGKAPEKGAH